MFKHKLVNPEAMPSREAYSSVHYLDGIVKPLSPSALQNFKERYGNYGTIGKFIRIGKLILIAPQAVVTTSDGSENNQRQTLKLYQDDGSQQHQTFKLYHNDILTGARRDSELEQVVQEAVRLRRLASLTLPNNPDYTSWGMECLDDAGWYNAGIETGSSLITHLQIYGHSLGYGEFPLENRKETISIAQVQMKQDIKVV